MTMGLSMTWRAEQKLNRVIANIHAFAQYMPAQTFDVLDSKGIIVTRNRQSHSHGGYC